MANSELNPMDWRDVQVLRAQGVLAELHTVDMDQADRGLRAYAATTGGSLHTVARQVVDRDLIISRELCVPAPAPPRRLQQQPDRTHPSGGESRPGQPAGVDQEAARPDL
jgi:hypothetical protein